MGTHACPGKGLSLSQLVFALNEELKRTAYSPLYVAEASPWMRFLNLIKVFRLRWRVFASGGTPSLASTVSRWISFPSSPPIFLPSRTVFAPVLCAVVGAEPSSSMAPCGLSCSSKRVKPTSKPFSNARKGLRWI
ncbi:hypothetical protein BDM02DRAFT_245253 [Thelephora ganbajun]|uniref:Uncharacterized protein n=1 Tax=Thelephora ganbajun TaxID=370292 RepID=A0ACB6ZRP9_THEGA|nr:hypothetical protein BDM02DRAFT_245253 [Thelephora ganbajun]